ncbi:MAG: CoA-binding protein [bacterium]|nr:CoA-binding protein [bacterium]MDT8396290.1 CoA-binding protein [bacterium]
MDIETILKQSKTVAVVGLSSNPDRASHRVAAYLQQAGYRIVPVRPGEDEILGEKVYTSLKEIPFPVDIVDVFRKPDAVGPVVDEAIEIGAKVLWLQEGVTHPEAEDRARSAGLTVISDLCILSEHRKAAL